MSNTAPAPSARKTCRCGCKAQVVSKKATYLAGHDARHAGVVGRSLTGNRSADAKRLAVLPTEALQAKAVRVAVTAKAKASAKKAKAKVTV